MRSPRTVTIRPIGLPLPDLEVRDRPLGARDHRLLAGDRRRGPRDAASSAFAFCVASPRPMLSTTFCDARHLHHVRVAELAHERRAQSRRGSAASVVVLCCHRPFLIDVLVAAAGRRAPSRRPCARGSRRASASGTRVQISFTFETWIGASFAMMPAGSRSRALALVALHHVQPLHDDALLARAAPRAPGRACRAPCRRAPAPGRRA